MVPALTAAFAVAALAQQPEPSAAGAPPAAAAPPAGAPVPAPKKHKHHHAAAEPAAAAAGGAKPTLLGQYGEWGAYTASPGGKKICFAIAKPSSSETVPAHRPRDPAYMFVSSRPADKVSDELSIIIGYTFKPDSEATMEIGSTSFALYTQKDGAWIKNTAEEAHLVDAMRAGQNAVVKGTSSHGTRTTDIFSLKGLAQALDRSNQDCK
jgi:Invasion associated locus B (IalB) protein